jgi:hypothetical protein
MNKRRINSLLKLKKWVSCSAGVLKEFSYHNLANAYFPYIYYIKLRRRNKKS